MSRVGAVVVTHGRGEGQVELVRALRADGFSAGAVVVARAGEPDRGFPHTANIGIREQLDRSVDYVLLLPHDVGFEPGALHRLVATAEAAPEVGILGPVVWWRGEDRPISYGGVLERSGRPTHALDGPLPADERGIADAVWIDAAAMLVRSTVFDDVGMLDDRFFLYFFEVDFCRRAAAAGWRIGVAVDVRVEQTPSSAGAASFEYHVARDGLEYTLVVAGLRGVARELRRLGSQAVGMLRLAVSPRTAATARAATSSRLGGLLLGTISFVGRRHGPAPARVGRSAPRAVVVAPFPPRRDGIARYAEQYVEALRAERAVLTVGLPGSNADRVVALAGDARPLLLLRLTRRRDELVVMWHAEYFLRGGALRRILARVSLGVVFRLRTATVVVHEPDLVPPGGALAGIEDRARNWCWRAPASMVFHTARERDAFGVPFERTNLAAHGRHFRASALASRDEARGRLTIEPDGTIFLCIGFLGPHKGFDRALAAFARLSPGVARLYVVGSPLYPSPESERFVAELRRSIEETPGATLVERFVDDEEFDLWVQAADVVLLPYREASSSSVLERARLLGTPVIASPAGGLPEQIGPHDVVARSDEELAEAMALRVESGS